MDLKYSGFKEVLISIIAGFFIGFSVIVPGISGSTIAIVLKVYDKLMYAFSNIFKKFKLCFVFLLPILGGIVLGFALGFVLVKVLLESFPFITICFFVGLMGGTFPLLFKEIKGEKLNYKRVLLFVAGVVVPLIITVSSMFMNTTNSLDNIQFWHYILFLVIGVLISLTQLIPGLSATVLLMMFGYYSSLMAGISLSLFTNVKLIFLYVTLAVGFVIGTLLFSKGINKLLESFKKPFFFVICGLSVSSLISVFLGSDCLEIYDIWSRGEGSMTGDLIVGAVFLIIGVLISLVFFFLDLKNEKNKQNEEQKTNTEQ